jgi:hypothetical protein
MSNKLTITILAGALAFVGLPAFAFDLPDSGSKNFSPPGDTPSYFSNEAAPVSARTADTTPRDWSAVDALVPEQPATDSVHQASRRYGKYASAARSGKHASSKASHYSGANARTVRAKSTVNTTTARHGKASTRHARTDISNPAVII